MYWPSSRCDPMKASLSLARSVQALDYQTAWSQGIESNHISSRAIVWRGNHFRTLTWLVKTDLLTCLDFNSAKVSAMSLAKWCLGMVTKRCGNKFAWGRQSWAIPKRLIFSKISYLALVLSIDVSTRISTTPWDKMMLWKFLTFWWA